MLPVAGRNAAPTHDLDHRMHEPAPAHNASASHPGAIASSPRATSRTSQIRLGDDAERSLALANRVIRRTTLHPAIIPLVTVSAPSWLTRRSPHAASSSAAGLLAAARGDVRERHTLPPLLTPLVSLHAPSWPPRAALPASLSPLSAGRRGAGGEVPAGRLAVARGKVPSPTSDQRPATNDQRPSTNRQQPRANSQ